MLIEFRVENHRSLRDEVVLTMAAGRGGDESDSRPRQVSGHAESLLTVAAIYGANASGKSNVLSALNFLREAVLLSHRVWAPDEGILRNPFAWGPKRAEPSLFEVTFLVDSVRFQYGFVASDECFLEEWLRAWPNGKKQTWFEREAGKPIKFGEHLKGENKLIEEVTRPNALFLAAAAQHGHAQLQPISSWFRSLTPLKQPMDLAYSESNIFNDFSLARLFENEAGESKTGQQQPLADESGKSLREQFLDLIRTADVGIVDVKIITSDRDDLPPRLRPVGRFLMRHQSDVGDAWLPREEESRGTQTLFRMALPILYVMAVGGVLIVDELEASLHPALAQQIVRQFNDPTVNHKNAQILFTTHDTNLLGTTLGEPALRRDQVWMTEKNPEGATVLYPLTDYKPRKAENLERGYLQGRYGAIPFLGDFSMAGK